MKTLYLFMLGVIISSSVMAMAPPTEDKYVQQAEKWLQDLDKATADFQQIDHQGNVIRGKFYINRPGRLRFEYQDPIKNFIVADGVQIHFYDAESEQYNSAPIGMTLADFILRDNPDGFHNDKIKIANVHMADNRIAITIKQADQPEMGSLILKYSLNPFILEGWRIMDAQGLSTDIILNNFDRKATIPASYFTVDNRNLNE